MRAKIQRAALTALMCLVAGCASIEPPYVPSHVGPLPDEPLPGPVSARLIPEAPEGRIGDVVRFRIVLRNEGKDRVWIPERPEVAMRWIYPDGRRDNSLAPEAAGSVRLVPLEAGREVMLRFEVPTYYFDAAGITEFQAMVALAGSREIPSDRYGLLLHPAADDSNP